MVCGAEGTLSQVLLTTHSYMQLTETHIRVLERICIPEDRAYTYVHRLDPVVETYYVARESAHLLYTIAWRCTYSKNLVVRDLLKIDLIARAKVVLYTRRRVRILEVLYPTMRGEELYYRVFEQESWTQYAVPDIRESRGLDEIAIDFTFRLQDLQRLQLAVKQ